MRGAFLLFIFYLAFLLPIEAFSQKKQGGDGLTKEESELLTKAEFFYDERNFLRALPIYDQLAKAHPDVAYFKYKAGICYLYKSDEKERSIPLLTAADSIDPTLDDITYYLGRAYHLNYKFDDALALLNDYLRKNPKGELSKRAARYVEHCNNGKILVDPNFEVEVDINNIGPNVNTNASEYVPVISADQSIMIFTYRGEKSTGGLMDLKFRPDPEGEYYEDVFISKIVQNNWTTPQPIGTNINTKMHDAAIALSPDGQKLFIFKSTAKDRGDIFMSTLNGLEWSVPVRLGKTINTNYWEGSVSITADEQTLYFASERPGGIGGRDIYKSKKLANGEWGPAENLGPSINTPYDDDAPFIHPDGITLFFSSQGHNSIGGYDVMYSIWRNEAWTPPSNLGYPINTTEDDIYYVLSADGETGYYASNRKGGFGQQDIYTINPGFLGEKPILALVFGVVSAENKPVNATIQVTNNQTGDTVGTYQSNSATGKFIVALTPGSDYKIAFEFEGMETHIEYVNVKKLETYVQIQHDIKLNPKGGITVQDTGATLQKKFDKQIEKYYEESKAEYCMEKVYKILLDKYGELEYSSSYYRVELGTFADQKSFRSDNIKDLGTIQSSKDAVNNWTYFFGDVKTLKEADQLMEKVRKRDSTYTGLRIVVIDKTVRKLLPEYFAKDYKMEGCIPDTATAIVPTTVVQGGNFTGPLKGLDSTNKIKDYKNLVKDDTTFIAGISYKVELMTVTDTNDFNLQRLEKYGKIEKKLYPDGKWRYSMGPFKTLKESEDFKKMLIEKEPAASSSIITVFVFGERKTLEEFKGMCPPFDQDFAWFVGKDLNDTAVYNKLISIAGNNCKSGLIFKVQIGAYRFPKNFKYPTVEEFGPAEIIAYPDGITRFTMKQFETLKDAEKFRQVVIGRGIKDAWITAVYKGKRMLLDELIKVNFYGKSVN